MAVERGAEGFVTVALPLPHLDIEYGSVVQKKLDSFATRVGHAASLASPPIAYAVEGWVEGGPFGPPASLDAGYGTAYSKGMEPDSFSFSRQAI